MAVNSASRPLRETRSRANPGGMDVLEVLGEEVRPFRERKPPWLKVPAPGGPRFREAQAPDRRRAPEHRLRGSRVPQRRRVLGTRHGHLHDPRRHVHATLRVLQRQDRHADVRRPAGARARRPLDRAHGPASRGDHVGRPRRPTRLRRVGVRRRDPADPPAGARLQGRGADTRLPRRRDAAREGARRAPRRLQPQRRGRAPAVSGCAARLAFRALLPRAAQREGDGRRRSDDEVRPDGRARGEASTS